MNKIMRKHLGLVNNDSQPVFVRTDISSSFVQLLLKADKLWFGQ